MWKKLFIALAYASTSFGITIINKVVLTSYKFPSYQCLGLCQIAASIIFLGIARMLNLVSYPPVSFSLFKKLFPLPLIYVGNMLTGLGATQKLNLPMFTVLRRFSIPMTMIGEIFILRKRFSKLEQFSVSLMLAGAIVAALYDLSFDVFGYTMIMCNNFCTAMNNIYLKKKADAKEIGEFGILFYNSLFTFVPALLILYNTDDIDAIFSATCWNEALFCLYFILSSVMGFLLMYTTMLSNVHISPTSTTVIGTLKNVLVAYIGMFIGGDYHFEWLNFVGLNISLVGGVLHSAKSFGLHPLRICKFMLCCLRKTPSPPRASEHWSATSTSRGAPYQADTSDNSVSIGNSAGTELSHTTA